MSDGLVSVKGNVWCALFVCFAFVFFIAIRCGVASSEIDFKCGGHVELEVWNIWDTSVRDYIDKRQIQYRLLEQRDVYALYDIQTFVHNLVAMAQRCRRVYRLVEVAQVLKPAYGALESESSEFTSIRSSGRRWICRGGKNCNPTNRRINTEVKLCSLQFLGLSSSVANALAVNNIGLNVDDATFVRETAQIVIEHLLRWADERSNPSIYSFKNGRGATLDDVADGSAAFLFTDKALWLISIFAELAGVLEFLERQGTPVLSTVERTRLQSFLEEGLKFFKSRISFQYIDNEANRIVLADLDRGFWQFRKGNKYAGYEESIKPVECLASKEYASKNMLVVRVSVEDVPKRDDIGWDISHARRLVHVLNSLERNRLALQSVFNLSAEQLPPKDIVSAFSNMLVKTVWNGDVKEPLFSNYWCGANGWYRVAYDNGTGKCQEGYPPYGLSDSFLTGGYISWAGVKPEIGRLGKRFYNLVSNPHPEELLFMSKYYPKFIKPVNQRVRSLSRMMFLPSLVGVSIK